MKYHLNVIFLCNKKVTIHIQVSLRANTYAHTVVVNENEYSGTPLFLNEICIYLHA